MTDIGFLSMHRRTAEAYNAIRKAIGVGASLDDPEVMVPADLYHEFAKASFAYLPHLLARFDEYVDIAGELWNHVQQLGPAAWNDGTPEGAVLEHMVTDVCDRYEGANRG